MKINLAWCDIRNGPQRFLLTVVGVGAILTATFGMNGLYRGIVYEALLIIRDIGADFWIVQGSRSGPFAELSSVSETMERRLEGVAGVRNVRRFTSFNKQFTLFGRRRGITVIGLDFRRDSGHWLDLMEGRYLSSNRGEAIADRSIGLVVGDTVRLGRDEIIVVGVTAGQVDAGGDGLFFVTIADAQDIERNAPSEAVLLNRAMRTLDPLAARGRVNAIILELVEGADPAAVRSAILSWGDVNVLDRTQQEDILLNGRLWRLRVQILAFLATMLVVAGVVIALIIYTMTLEKLHSIAVLKLLGARNSVLVWMILQISLLIGGLAFGGAIIASHLIYPFFPRTILLLGSDLAMFFAIVQSICALAAVVGIRRALAVRAQEVLA